MNGELKNEITSLLVEYGYLSPRDTDNLDTLDELGVNSLDILDVLVDLEEKYEVDLSDIPLEDVNFMNIPRLTEIIEAHL